MKKTAKICKLFFIILKNVPTFFLKLRKFLTVMNSAKTVLFGFFSLKPSLDQDKDDDICYSPIGSAFIELLDGTQIYRQTDRYPITLYIVRIVINVISSILSL